MKKIMFNNRFGLTAAVLDGSKTMTRRIIPLTAADEEYIDHAFDWDLRESVILDRYAKYKVGERVAIAQTYKDCGYKPEDILENVDGGYSYARDLAGYTNKMFVQSMHMINFIEFTERKIERLQDISKEDCLKEGIDDDSAEGAHHYWYSVPNYLPNWRALSDKVMRHEWNGEKGCWFWDTAQGAFSALINAVCGKGTWEQNPWVIAYSFKLQKGALA